MINIVIAFVLMATAWAAIDSNGAIFLVLIPVAILLAFAVKCEL